MAKMTLEERSQERTNFLQTASKDFGHTFGADGIDDYFRRMVQCIV